MEHTHEKHEHHHGECCCGHKHGNHHHTHEYYHSHEHVQHVHKYEQHIHKEQFLQVSKSVKQSIYILENLGCANCAAKMEKKINELPEVEIATITFATKQLQIVSEHSENLLPVLQEICSSIEGEVVVKPKQTARQKTEKETHISSFIQIGVGASLFAIGLLAQKEFTYVAIASFVVAYFILGGRILFTAGKNLLHGRIFDENFLMGIATLAAFVIGDYPEAVGVMLFFRVGELFEDIAVEKSRSQIMEVIDMRPEMVNLIQNHIVNTIPAEDAGIGDVLLVRPGDRIPLDGVVVHGESRIDTAPITGEPVPVKVGEGDKVVSGCVNMSGTIHVKAEQTLENSMVSRILYSVENASASKPKIDRFITRFARVYTPFVVSVALLTAIVPSLITGEWRFWIYTAITFLVISCPCALVLSVPLAFFSGIGTGSKKGILFKGGVSLETMKHIKVVIMDKTGTITKGNFEVQKIVAKGEYTAEQLLALAASCEMDSTHPIALSIVAASNKRGLNIERPRQTEEISGKGIHAYLEEGEVLCGNLQLLEDFQIKSVEDDDEEHGTKVFLALNGKYIGHLLIADTIKEETQSAISKLKKLGLRIVMLTGDSSQCAKAVAEKTGIEEYHAKLLPEDKLHKLKEIRKQYGPTMFVGDGINDAPVLAGADVGAAMGSGADAAMEAADVVFMTSSMEAIPESIALAKSTNRIAVQNVIFALTVKALVMIFGLFGFANMWMAVFADTGVAMLCVLNSVRILRRK